MIKISLLFIFVGLSSSLWGQTDKVFLKNGSVIRGQLTFNSTRDTIDVCISEGVIRIPTFLVEEIHSTFSDDSSYQSFKTFSYPQGWSTSISGALTLGRHSYDSPLELMPALSVGQFFRFSPYLNIGLNAGFFPYKNYATYPVYMEYYIFTGKSRSSFTLYCDVGYGFAGINSETTLKGGFYSGGGIGWLQKAGSNTIHFKAGFTSQITKIKTESNNTYIEITDRHINRITFQVSYMINYK